MKKLLSLMVGIVMVLAMGTSALAGPGETSLVGPIVVQGPGETS